MIRSGVDVIRVSRMQALVDDPAFLSRAFNGAELSPDKDAGTLACMFALKEAFYKAAQPKIARWSDITIIRRRGKHFFSLQEDALHFGLEHRKIESRAYIKNGYACALVLVKS